MIQGHLLDTSRSSKAFDGPKARFSSEEEVPALLAAVQREGMLGALQAAAGGRHF